MSAAATLYLDAYPDTGQWFYRFTEPAAPRQRPAGNLRLVHDRSVPGRAHTDSEDREMSDTLKTTEDVAADQDIPSENQIRDTVAEAIEGLCLPAKRIARHADMTPPAVKSWLMRRNTMSLTAFVRLCRQHPTFRAAAARLLDLERAIDPQFEADLLELQAALSKTLERR